MDITVRTVEFHLSNIYSKLEVASRTEAVLKLVEIQLRESTGVSKNDYLRESTVDMGDETTENGGKSISRRIHMRNRLYIIGGGRFLVGGILALVIVAISLVFVGPSIQVADYHTDAEIAQEAIQSGRENFDSAEMRIITDDPVQVGTTVLNQFLKKFRQRETHYGIRLVSYEILELDFIEEANDQLYYTARIKVTPQDKARFIKTLDGVFPYEENDDGMFISFTFTIFQRDDMYKLVDIASDV
jgi:hypothetical protein